MQKKRASKMKVEKKYIGNLIDIMLKQSDYNRSL